MKGIHVNLILTVIIAVVTLVVIFLFIRSAFSGQKSETFMNLPGGVIVSLESADTKIFVLPPVVWFGKTLGLNGNSVNFEKVFTEGNTKPTDFIFPTNSVYTKEVIGFPSTENFKYLDVLTSVLFAATFPLGFPSEFTNPTNLTYNFTTRKPVSPVIAFYPLITDDFGSLVLNASAESGTIDSKDFYYLNPKKPFGTVNFSLTIDAKELYKYYRSKHKIFDKDEAEDNINLSLEYSTNLDYEPKNYLETIGIEKNTTSLGDLKNRGICKKNSDLYTCSFSFNIAEKCCPSFVSLRPIFKINLSEEGSSKWEEEKIDPIFFQIIYYLDYLKDKDFIFKNFSEIKENFKKDDGPNPIKDILIYPCRAIARLDKGQIPLLPSRVKSFDNKIIDWDKCESATGEFIQLTYLNLEQNSTWFCRKSDSGDYFIYNPYAFCRLNGEELSGTPEPIYLQGIIPSGGLTKRIPSVPIYIGPGWTPKEGWGIYILKNPTINYKTYREAALIWADYMIYNTTKTLVDGGNINFPEPIDMASTPPIRVEFEFGE